jgi:hypothetical protein
MTETKEKNNEDIEEIFKRVGEFGPYQLALFVFVSMSAFVCSMASYGFTFYGASPKHRCKLPEFIFPNDTYQIQSKFHQEIVEEFIPESNIDALSSFDQCNLKNFSITNETSSNFTLMKCSEWVFSNEYYEKTLVTEVKNRRYFRP